MESCSGNGGDPLISAAVGGSLCLMGFGDYAIPTHYGVGLWRASLSTGFPCTSIKHIGKTIGQSMELVDGLEPPTY